MRNLGHIFSRRPLALTAIVVLLAALLAALFVDRAVALWAAKFIQQDPLNYAIWSHVTELGRAEPYIAIAIISFIWLKFAPIPQATPNRRNFWASHASLLLLSLALSGLLVNIAKPLIGRLRPRYLLSDSNYGLQPFNFSEFGMNSFPSGHSQTIWAVAIVSLIVLRALCASRPSSNRHWQAYASAAIVLVAALVAASRVFLNKHFVSDVLVGSLIGALTPILLYPRWVAGKRD